MGKDTHQQIRVVHNFPQGVDPHKHVLLALEYREVTNPRNAQEQGVSEEHNEHPESNKHRVMVNGEVDVLLLTHLEDGLNLLAVEVRPVQPSLLLAQRAEEHLRTREGGHCSRIGRENKNNVKSSGVSPPRKAPPSRACSVFFGRARLTSFFILRRRYGEMSCRRATAQRKAVAAWVVVVGRGG